MAAKLWRGSTGDSVRDLQRKLNANGYELDEDGVFGNNTYNAVVDYQRKYNLRVDGVVGEETWGSLLKTTEPEQPTTGKEILQGVNLKLKTGEIHAIMGPNGTGKSTLSESIMGNPAYTVTQGSVTLDGKNLLDMTVDERARAGLF